MARGSSSRRSGSVGPVDALAEDLVLAHMGQHLLIADLAAPFLLVGLRSPVYAFYLPRPLLVRARAPASGCGASSASLRRPLVAVPSGW